MSRQISPSVRRQSFNCPHCGANSHQTWYKCFAKRSKEVPHLWDSEMYQELELAEDKKPPEERFSPDIMEWFMNLSEGEIILDESSQSESCRFAANNVFFSQCFTCNKVAVWRYESLLYPSEPEAEEANSDMPENVKRDYNEARVIFKYSPKGAAALLRLCIEKLCNCEELKAEGETLNQKIGDLVKRGLSPKVQKALDSVRVIGNEAVHPGQIDLNDNKEVGRALFKLVNLIVTELITEEKEVEAIFELLPENKKDGIKSRDKKVAAND